MENCLPVWMEVKRERASSLLSARRAIFKQLFGFKSYTCIIHSVSKLESQQGGRMLKYLQMVDLGAVTKKKKNFQLNSFVHPGANLLHLATQLAFLIFHRTFSTDGRIVL